MWQRLVIGSDGKVLLCSQDEYGLVIVGDVNEESIYDVWHGKKLRKARESHLKKMGVEEVPPCKFCVYPRKTIPTTVQIGNTTVSSFEYINWDNAIEKNSSRYSIKSEKDK